MVLGIGLIHHNRPKIFWQISGGDVCLKHASRKHVILALDVFLTLFPFPEQLEAV